MILDTMRYLNKVKSVRLISGCRLKLVFCDGFVGELDLSPLIRAPRGPMEVALQDPNLFGGVHLDGGTVAWPNGYDICPDVLRYWCEIGRVCSQEEVDAAFHSVVVESSALALHDKKS